MTTGTSQHNASKKGMFNLLARVEAPLDWRAAEERRLAQNNARQEKFEQHSELTSLPQSGVVKRLHTLERALGRGDYAIKDWIETYAQVHASGKMAETQFTMGAFVAKRLQQELETNASHDQSTRNLMTRFAAALRPETKSPISAFAPKAAPAPGPKN